MGCSNYSKHFLDGKKMSNSVVERRGSVFWMWEFTAVRLNWVHRWCCVWVFNSAVKLTEFSTPAKTYFWNTITVDSKFGPTLVKCVQILSVSPNWADVNLQNTLKTVLVLIFYKLVVDIGNLFRNKPIVSLIMSLFFNYLRVTVILLCAKSSQ